MKNKISNYFNKTQTVEGNFAQKYLKFKNNFSQAYTSADGKIKIVFNGAVQLTEVRLDVVEMNATVEHELMLLINTGLTDVAEKIKTTITAIQKELGR